MSLVHVSLFSGVGGIDLAMLKAGIPTAAACEIDKAARGVLNDRFPGVPLFTDVKDVTGNALRNLGIDPTRTVLSGGFPCQDLSVAGNRAGMDQGSGTRSALFWEIDRILGEFNPAWVVLENVPGLLSSRGGADMGAVVGSLADRGYGFAWRVLDAQFFGVPQRRRRVVIVGRFGDDGRAPAQVLFDPEGVCGDSAPSNQAGPGTTGETGSGAVGGGVARTLIGRQTSHDPELDNYVVSVLGERAHTLTGEGHDASEDGTGRGTPVVAYQQQGSNVGPMGTLRAGNGSHTGGVPFVTFALRGRAEGAMPEMHGDGDTVGAQRAGDGGSSRDYVIAPHVAATLTANAGGGRRQEDDQNIVAFAGQTGGTVDMPVGDKVPTLGTTQVHSVAYAAEQASTLQASGGERGYRIDAEGAAGGHLIATYQKVTRAKTGDDPETWEPRDVAATLTPHDLGSGTRTVELAITTTPDMVVRRLTPLECERLQGFPDGHTSTSWGKPQADSPRYRQMGNSVAVPVFAWVATRIARQEAA